MGDAEFVNIGADSKDNGLEEPTYDEIMELYELLQCGEVLVKKKVNLGRLENVDSVEKKD